MRSALRGVIAIIHNPWVQLSMILPQTAAIYSGWPILPGSCEDGVVGETWLPQGDSLHFSRTKPPQPEHCPGCRGWPAWLVRYRDAERSPRLWLVSPVDAHGAKSQALVRYSFQPCIPHYGGQFIGVVERVNRLGQIGVSGPVPGNEASHQRH